MMTRAPKENPPGFVKPEGDSNQKELPEGGASATDTLSKNSANWVDDIEETLKLGEQFVGVIFGLVDLARTEALLAMRTLPKMLVLCLLIVPIIFLTWCAFSALVAWFVFAATEAVGLGVLAFFLLQILLLLVCRLLYVKYRKRMTLPYTRAQIDHFVRSTKDGFGGGSTMQE